jgi:hypothetical protein
MQMPTEASQLIATVDVRTLETLKWGLMRQLFPCFAEEIELGRFLRALLSDDHYGPVRIVPHRDSAGCASTHVFDVFTLRPRP